LFIVRLGKRGPVLWWCSGINREKIVKICTEICAFSSSLMPVVAEVSSTGLRVSEFVRTSLTVPVVSATVH